MLPAENLLRETPGRFNCFERDDREELNHDEAATEVPEHPAASSGAGQSCRGTPSGHRGRDPCISASALHMLRAAPGRTLPVSCLQWILQQPRDGGTRAEERIRSVVITLITQSSHHCIDCSHTCY